MSDYKSAHEDEQFDALCKSLRMSINAALSVGGPERDDGKAGRLRDTDIFKQTGIARSTLRNIKNRSTEHATNPDLRTLKRLADTLGVPLAFLLMTPEDWELLIKSIGDLKDTTPIASEILGSEFGSHATVRRVLEYGGLLTMPRPFGASHNHSEQTRLDKINEDRRRVSHVIGALMLRQPEYKSRQEQHVALVALAASITNQIKQHNT